MLKLERPICFFDLETTGTNQNNDRIVQIAMVRLDPGASGDETAERFDSLVNPGIPIPQAVVDIHGIDDEKVSDAPKFEDIVEEVWKFLKGADLAGFNIRRFDIPLLMVELDRCRYRWDLRDVAIVDAMEIFHRKEPRDLEAAVRRYCNGREHEGAHSAISDVMATMVVLSGQLGEYNDVPRVPAEIDKMFRDPDAVDISGQLKRVDGKIVLTFGKHKGQPLDELPIQYLVWLKKNNVLALDAVPYINPYLAQNHRRKAAAAKKRAGQLFR
jgi:DNA polymerase-3 subunit epsilon